MTNLKIRCDPIFQSGGRVSILNSINQINTFTIIHFIGITEWQVVTMVKSGGAKPEDGAAILRLNRRTRRALISPCVANLTGMSLPNRRVTALAVLKDYQSLPIVFEPCNKRSWLRRAQLEQLQGDCCTLLLIVRSRDLEDHLRVLVGDKFFLRDFRQRRWQYLRY